MHDIKTGLGAKDMSDLSMKEIDGIYIYKKNLTKQEIQRYKTWASDGFVYFLSNLALKIIIHFRSL